MAKDQAYQGELFDPDRFPFLEGRTSETKWKETPCQPIPVDNRTVLHLLEALQVLQVKLPGGGPATPRKLSFRALSILQIGHVYEGLLDHTAVKATEPVLGLSGPRDHEPEVPLSRLEALVTKGENELLAFVKGETGRSSVATVKRLLATAPDDLTLSRFRTTCQGDEKLWERIKPFAGLVRLDTFDYPVVILPRSVYVTAGTDRRSSGTHYTPESLTEPIVRYTLEPLVYEGPAEGKPREQWRLKSAKELLDLKICDMACGSGAFLVQVCIYLAERLLEAWEEAEKQVQGSPRITPYGEVSKGLPDEQLIPLDRQERLIYARRLVAERCVYGVDKNPLAVEMAKLSLWLLTLAKDKPFTFLDHAIRCGDSLVGLSSIDQLLRFSLSENAKVRPLMEQQRQHIEKRLRATMLLRKQIETLPSNTPQDIERKAKVFENVVDQTKRLTYAADMLLAVTWEAKNVGELESGLNGMLAEVEYKFKDLPAEQLEDEAEKRLRKAGIAGRFHWHLEFPEVFVDRAGFNAFVCNPPFMGGQKITGNMGTAYRDYLVEHLARGKRGSADLCAYFTLRAASLMRDSGQFGFLATNTIAQGDTREVGLDQLMADGYVIPRANPSRPWPGTASLEVAHVWLRRGQWKTPFVLDDKPVSSITPFLTEPGTVSGPPHHLTANAGKSFIGSYVLGMGFVLMPEEARSLIERNPRNKDVLFPYINGEDINSIPDQAPRRWVINFYHWPLNRETAPDSYDGPVASDYPDCLDIVAKRAKPDRDRLADGDASARDRAKRWWQFARPTLNLYSAIAGLERVIGIALTSKTLMPDFVSSKVVLDQTIVVLTNGTTQFFAIVASSLHRVWALNYGATLRTDQRYNRSECFETFPFPDVLCGLGAFGQTCCDHRRQIMLSRQEGLTKTYNRFHDPDESAADIQKLRDLHVEMDKAVAAVYGWSDLDLGHGFHETKQGMRFTISESARREVLARLLKLNHERYAEEVAQGLHDKKGKPKVTGRKGKRTPSDEESLLF